MIHLVQASGVWEDGKPDFLVNEVPDIDDLPDTLYQSNGSTNHVEVVRLASWSPSFSLPPVGNSVNAELQLTAPMPNGWAYLRVPDPGDGAWRLTRVLRSDGVEISLNTNVGITDRTFIGLGRPPIRENILHLLDYNSTGSYTLTYEPGSTTIQDTNAPSSSVTNLPALSRPYFQVNWSGRDEGPLAQAVSGVAYYDIFVSENDGPFVPWLQQTHLVSATYIGTLDSHYAFYSVATDANGNREQPPFTADAETFVSVTNSPPSITLPAVVTLNEGETLDLSFTASDLDADQNLTFSLLPGGPPGVVLNAAARRLTWSTGEGNGPGTNLVAVVVRDDDFPSLSATGRVTVVVNEVNTAPILAALTNRTVSEGQLLTFTTGGSDIDLPGQHLNYALGRKPAGAFINTNSGLFSWRPNEIQGGTNYPVDVIVSDDGVPSLSATQSFIVTVKNTASDFVFSIGSTNLFVGESNSVPLAVASGVELRELSFLLETDPSRLGSLAVHPLAVEVGSVSFQPLNASQSQVQLIAGNTASLEGAGLLARLEFVSLSNEHSAIVPLRALNVQGRQADGNLLADPSVGSGRVFIVGREPILDAALRTNGMRVVTLYGHPSRYYVIESRTNLLAGPWNPVAAFDLTNPVWPLEDIGNSEPNVFFRAVEFARSSLKVRLNGGQVVISWPASSGTCVLEQTGSLTPPVVWSPVTETAQVVGDDSVVSLAGSGDKFYRLRCNP